VDQYISSNANCTGWNLVGGTCGGGSPELQ
jgi:hypothetical protein